MVCNTDACVCVRPCLFRWALHVVYSLEDFPTCSVESKQFATHVKPLQFLNWKQVNNLY